jgi:uncharacterized membrane protein
LGALRARDHDFPSQRIYRDAVPADPAVPDGSPTRAAAAYVPTWARLVTAALVGVVVGVAMGVPMTWQLGLPLGWSTAAAVYVVWSWATIWPMDADATASHAVREDPGRAASDIILVSAAVVSLVAVGLLLLSGSHAGVNRDVQAGVSVASVALSWAAVHTMFAERYARLYYTGPDGGIDFKDRPQYSDFAYLAFTIGMTFQVSDTEVASKEIRAAVLRHALVSYLLGVVVIAATINLIASLSR